MEDENKKLLLEVKALVKENNDMLKAIRGNQKIALFMKIAKWVVIIIFAILVSYFVGPMLKGLLGTYQSVGGDSQNSSAQDLLELQQFLNDN